MKYTIKRGNTELVTVTPEGWQTKQAMGVNMVEMNFTLLEPVEFEKGDYCIVYGEKYIVINSVPFRKLSNHRYEYSMKLVHEFYTLQDVIFKGVGHEGELTQLKFSMTGTATHHMALLIANANRVQSGWTLGVVDATPSKNISYDGENLLQVLNRLASEFDTEYWIENKTIHLTKRTGSSGITLSYGKDKGLLNLTKTNKDDAATIFTRLYVEGGDKNLPVGYRNGAKYLQLPEDTPYIEDSAKVSKYGVIEGYVSFDEVYPRRVGTVSALGDDIYTFSDSGINFNVNDYLLPATSAKITFQDGLLAGYTFEISSFNYATKTFVINEIEEAAIEGGVLPNDDFKPSLGDHYVLHDIQMPASYVEAAEEELLELGEDYYALGSDIEFNDKYQADCDPLYFKRNNIDLSDKLGKTIDIIDTSPEINVSKRLATIRRDLQNAWKYELDLTDKIELSALARSYADSKRVKLFIAGASGLLGGDSASKNSFLASLSGSNGYLYIDGKKSKAGYADQAQDAAHAVNAELANIANTARRVESASFASGMFGHGHRLDVNGEGKSVLELDSLIVRDRLTVNELAIMRLKSIGGTFVVSNSVKITTVSGSAGEYTLGIDTDGGTIGVPFTVGAAVFVRNYNGSNQKYYAARVTGVSSASFDIEILDGTDTPEAGDELVQLDHYTESNEKGIVLLSAADSGAPYIDVHYGYVTNPTDSLKVRLGRLDGISDPDLGTLSGFGFYGQNVYIKGTLVATGGNVVTEDVFNDEIAQIDAQFDAIGSDNVATPQEKRMIIKPTYDSYASEVEDIKAQAAALGVDSTAFNNAFYVELKPYVEPILTNLNTASPADGAPYNGATLRSKFVGYVTQRSLLLKAIAQKQQEVAQDANDKIDGLQIANENLLKDSSFERVRLPGTQLLSTPGGPTPFTTNTRYSTAAVDGSSSAKIQIDIFSSSNHWAFAVPVSIANNLLDHAPYGTIDKLKGKTVTYSVSIMALGNAANKPMNICYAQVGSNSSASTSVRIPITLGPANVWRRYNVSFDVASNTTYLNIYFEFKDTDGWQVGDAILMDCDFLGIGNKAPEGWLPSPFDVFDTTAKIITLSASTQIIQIDKDGNKTPANPFTVTGVAQNTTITSWQYSVDGGTYTNTTPTGVSRSGDTVTVNPNTVTFKTLSIRASDGTYSDTLTIAVARDGVDGEDGAGIAIKGSVPTYADLSSLVGLTAGDAYLVEADGKLYIWDGFQFPADGNGVEFKGDKGEDGYAVILTNESHTFAGSETAALAGSTTCDVLVYKGSTQLSASVSVGTLPTGLTANVSGSTITFTASPSLTTKSGTVDITINADGKTFIRKFSYSISFKGEEGEPAKVIKLNGSTQIITVDKNGVHTPSTSFTVVGNADNTIITAWEYSVNGGTYSSVAPTGVSRSSNTVTINPTTSTFKTLSIRASDGSISDVFTIARVSDGVNNIVGYLTNESVTLAASNTGVVSDFSPASGQFKVFNGTTQLTTGVSYSVVSQTNCTVTINTSGAYSVSAMSADNASAVLRATVGSVNIDKTLTLSKSKAGTDGDPGAAAPLLYLSSTSETMVFDADGTPNPASQTIIFTAHLQNVSGTATFVATPYVGNTAQSNITLGGSGNTRTLTQAQWGANVDRIEVTASLGSLSDTVTIVRLKHGAKGEDGINGEDGYTILLTNESHTFAGSETAALAGSTTTNIIAYKGATAVTPSNITVGTMPAGMTANVSGTTITFNVSNSLTTASGIVPITIVVDGKSFTRNFSYSISFKGQDGADGVSITNVDVEFAKNNNPSSAPTSGWSTTPPTLSGSEQLWTRTKTSYSSGSPTYSTPVNITPKEGAAGKGITSIVEEYYLSTSKTTQTGGSWVTTPPSWEFGKYMWTRVKITYTDSTTSYTTPIVSSEWEVINDLKVGSVNLLNNSEAPLLSPSTPGNGTAVLMNDEPIPYRRVTPNIGMGVGMVGASIPYSAGKTYIASVDVRHSHSSNINVGLALRFINEMKVTSVPPNVWVRITSNARFFDSDSNNSNLLLTVSGAPGVALDYRRIQIEEGNVATSWKPSLADTQAKITAAQTAANNAQAAATSAQAAADDLEEYVDGAFKDGVIEAAEAKSIEKYINVVNETYEQIVNSYNVVYNDPLLTGTPKTNLATAKTNLDTSKSSLLSAINAAIADGKTTPAEKTAVDNAYADFKTKIGLYTTAVENAYKSITDSINTKANTAQSAANAAALAASNALSAAATAQATADGKIKAFYQNSAPTSGMSEGDIWFDLDDGNKIYTYRSGSWVNTQDSQIAQAISSAQTAQTTADGKANVYYQNTAPTGLVAADKGDIWINTGDNNKMYVWSGTAWQLAQDYYAALTAANNAQSAATAAQTAANNAQNSANNALNQINNIVSDNVLDASEKPSQREKWNVAAAERSGINSQADVFGITTEKTAYNNAFQALANYLNGGSTWSSGVPSWLSDANLSTNTTIVGSTYRSMWESFYTARQNLLNAIAAKAKQLADAAQQTADNIKVGGENLLNNSDLERTLSSGGSLELPRIQFKKDEYIAWGVDVNLTDDDSTNQLLMMQEWETETTNIRRSFEWVLENKESGGWVRYSGVYKMKNNGWLSVGLRGYGVTQVKFKNIKLERGNKPTDWTPSLSDTQAKISAAQIAADNAQAAATSAQAAANNANALLADMSLDSKLTPVEKKQVKVEWDAIVSEKPKNESQADAFSVSKTSYQNAYNNLASYITPLLSNLSTTSDINAATFRNTFKAYYDARTDLLNAIAAKAKQLADAAQQAAEDAQSAADNAQSAANAAALAASNALSAAATAQATADGKIKAFYQNSAPTSGMSEGDIWFDLDDGNKIYTYRSGSWVNTQDSQIAQAISSAQTAQTTADGKANVYYQNTAPTGLVAADKGDIWINTGDNNKMYVWSGTAWQLAQDYYAALTAANNAQSAATAAQTAANNAQNSANNALNQINNIISDNVLDASEKPGERAKWDTIAAERAGINNQADLFAVTTEKTAYNNAFQTLANYLNGGSTWSSGIPSWLSDVNLGTNTTIVGSTYRGHWTNFYTARQNLLNAIAAKAKQLADAAQQAADDAQQAADDALDIANSKVTTYTSAPSSYKAGEFMRLFSNYTTGGKTFYAGKIYVANTNNTGGFNASHWDDALDVGGVNLVLDSDVPIPSTTSTLLGKYDLVKALESGKTYTVTIKGSGTSFVIRDDNGVNTLGTTQSLGGGLHRLTFVYSGSWAGDTKVFSVHNTAGGSASITWIKLEEGSSVSNEWSPAPQEMEYLKNALEKSTIVSGGLTLGTVIAVRDSSSVVRAYMNGDDSNPIAFAAGVSNFAGIGGAETQKIALYRDGSGFLASGNISWDNSGNLTVKGRVEAEEGYFKNGDIEDVTIDNADIENATINSSVIGGFQVSSNALTNPDFSARILFESAGASGDFIRLNEAPNSPLISVRTDSATRTGVSISTFATGARGLYIVSNAGSSHAIHSAGGHMFYQRSGETWNAPGILAAFWVQINNTSASLSNMWKITPLTISLGSWNSSTQTCRINHNLEHTEYVVQINTNNAGGWTKTLNRQATYFEFDMDDMNANNTMLQVLIIGRNMYPG